MVLLKLEEIHTVKINFFACFPATTEKQKITRSGSIWKIHISVMAVKAIKMPLKAHNSLCKPQQHQLKQTLDVKVLIKAAKVSVR